MKRAHERTGTSHSCTANSHQAKHPTHTLVHGSLLDIPNGGSLDHVAHKVTADGLVLGHAAAAVVAAHGLDVAAAVLVAAVVPALLSLSRVLRSS